MTSGIARCISCLSAFLLCACADEPVQVSHSGFGAFEPALVATTDGLAVAWNDNRHGEDEIYLRLLDDTLHPTSEELRLTNHAGSAFEADVAVLGDNFAIAWYDRDGAGRLRVKLGLWNAAGEVLWQRELTASERNGRVPVLQAVGDELFVAWVEELPYTAADPKPGPASWIHAARIAADGRWAVPPFPVSEASRTTWNLNADALPDGRIALVFDAQFATAASELYLALIDGDAVQRFRLTADDGNDSKYPDIAAGPSGGALTWFDTKDGNEEVYLALLDPGAMSLAVLDGFERDSRRVSDTAGASIGAYLAWNGAELGIAWCDDDAGQNDIFFQRFDAYGVPQTPALRLTETATDSLIPAIVPQGRGFALVWNEAVLGDSHTGQGQRETRSEIVIHHVQ